MARRVSRRRFLKLGIAGGVLLGAGGLLALHVGGYAVDAGTRRRLRFLDAKGYRILEAFANRVLDGCRPTAREVGVVLWIDGFVVKMDDRSRSDLRKLLGLLEHGTLLSADGVRRFTALTPRDQDRYLAGWESSRILVKRSGFAALKSLVLAGYYRDERTFASLDYHGPSVPRGYDVYAVPS